MKQWMKRTSAAVLAGLALTSSALASGTAVTLQENAVPAAQITAPAQQDWRLLLVNAWNLLPESYTVELVRLKNGLQVDKRIYDDLNAMLTDCRAAGLQPRAVRSGVSAFYALQSFVSKSAFCCVNSIMP